jgi:hypothetical protein
MLTKDDLFTSVSPAAIEVPKEKRKYAALTNKKRMVSQAERYQIGKLLEEHLTPKNAEGIVSYLNNMTDHKVAALIGPHVSYDTVRNMRQEVFGILKKFIPAGQGQSRSSQSSNDLLVRIERLEKLFDQLAEEIGSALRV